MSNNIPTLGGEKAKRKLNFFWLVDYSGSMGGKKIEMVNMAIKDVIPDIEKACAADVDVIFRAIKFSSSASWHVGPDGAPLNKFVWPDLSASGETATAQAIKMLCQELTEEKIGVKQVPPVCVLISDGYCTEPQKEYDDAISELDSLRWGQKAIRLAIAIGGDENDYDEAQLLKFVRQKEIGLLKAHNPNELVQYIKWASTQATYGASHGKSTTGAGGVAGATDNVSLPPPPTPQPGSSVNMTPF